MSREDMSPVEILLVEDNPGDADLTIEALEETKIRNIVNVATDGEMALNYLHKKGEFASANTPGLILLDLNLPKKSGVEVLQAIKNNEELHDIPVVILSSSEASKDLIETYGLNANAFVVKPVDLEKFFEVVQAIEKFWLRIVKLPEKRDT